MHDQSLVNSRLTNPVRSCGSPLHATGSNMGENGKDMVLNGRHFMCMGDAPKIAPNTRVDPHAPAI
jgi:hypothetical protein